MSERRTKGIGYVSWPTTRASDSEHGGPKQRDSLGNPALPGAVHMWATPAAQDGVGSHGGGQSSSLRTDIHNMKVKTGQQGQLNADWVECLMGFPIGWTNVEVESPQEWPGWPAPLNGGMWGTHTATHSARSRDFIRERVSPSEFVALKMEQGQYPYEPPRVITGQKHRAKRLKCCGNAVSPYQIKPIFEVIVAIEEGRIA